MSLTLKRTLVLIVALLFYVLPIKWVGSSAGLGCMFGYPEFLGLEAFTCYVWRLFRGLFLWPFSDVWSEVGMQMIMLIYLLFGVGTILMLLIFKVAQSKESK